MASYARCARLLKDQCIVEDTPPTDPDGDGPDGVPVQVKDRTPGGDPKTERIEPTSLQGSDDFTFSADGQRLERCPQGHAPIEQHASGPNDSRRTARMDTAACAACPLMQVCPTRFNGRAETMTFSWSPAEGATAARRRVEQTPAFKTRYRMRSGIEATNSEYKGPYGGGRLRVRGHPAVARTVKLKITALHIRRWMRAAHESARKAA